MRNKPLANSKLPEVIATRTAGLAPLIKAWAEQNKSVPFSVLIQRALKKELAPFATKRTAHLIEE